MPVPQSKLSPNVIIEIICTMIKMIIKNISYYTQGIECIGIAFQNQLLQVARSIYPCHLKGFLKNRYIAGGFEFEPLLFTN